MNLDVEGGVFSLMLVTDELKMRSTTSRKLARVWLYTSLQS